MATIDQAPRIAAPLGDVTTERLELRRLVPADIDELHAVFSDEAVWRYPMGRAYTRAESESFVVSMSADWDLLGVGLWVARVRTPDGVGPAVGYAGLCVPTFLPKILPTLEVGWRFHPSVWGNGFATEAASAALDEAFSTLGLAVVHSVPQRENEASVRVAERLGMRFVSEETIAANERRGAVVGMLYEITADEWTTRIHSPPSNMR